MKTGKSSALVLAMAGVFATTANAQSAKTNAWEGAYGQVSVGFAQFMPKVSGTTAAPTPGSLLSPYSSATPPGPLTASGSANTLSTGTAALGAGYNFGINKDYVLGVGVNYYPGASSSASGTFNLSAPGVGAPGNPYALNKSPPVTYNIKNLWSVTLNPGYVIDKDRLAYAKIGYTSTTIGLNGPIASYQTTNLSGYTLGLGYKQMITQSLYLLGEVNYGSFSNKNTTLATTIGTNVNTTLSGTGYDLLVGVGYRF